MLTTTYSLVALSLEQTSSRMDLSMLLKYFQRRLHQQQAIGRNDIYSLLNKLDQFHASFSLRKVELCLIPALRRVTKKADFLLAELESLGFLGLSVFRLIQGKLQLAMDQGMVADKEIYGEIQQYCSIFLQKIEKEEKELFCMAKNLMLEGEWFSIAVQFLSHDVKYAVKNPAPEPSAPPISPVKYLSYHATPPAMHLNSLVQPATRPVQGRRGTQEMQTIVPPELFQPPSEAARL